MRFRDGLKGRERGSRPARRGAPNMSKGEAQSARPRPGRRSSAPVPELQRRRSTSSQACSFRSGIARQHDQLCAGRSPADRRRRTHHRAARLSRGVGQGYEILRIGADAPALSPQDAWAAVLVRAATLHLAPGLTLRRSLVAGAQRLRLFVPVDPERGPAILAALSIATLSCAARSRRRGRPDNPVTNGE